MKEIEINGEVYVPKKDTHNVKAKSKKGMEYCIIRTYSAGVFAGWIDRKKKGMEQTIYDSRRIHYWDDRGSASLSQMANDGIQEVAKKGSRIAQVVQETDLKEIIEIIPCTDKSKKCLEEMPVWEFT